MKKFLKNKLLLSVMALVTALQLQGNDLLYPNLFEFNEPSLVERVSTSFGKLYAGQWDEMDNDDYSRIVGTSLITAGIGYGIYWYFFKKHPVVNNAVELDKTSFNYTYNRALSNNVHLRHIRVAGQRGATCGYHALKNGILVVNALHGYNADTLQEDLLSNDIADRVIEPWRVYVKNRRTKMKRTVENGENLYGDEIVDLSAIEQGKYPKKNAKHFIQKTLINSQCNFTVYDTYAQIDTPFDVEISKIKHLLQKKRTYTHIFIMNTNGSSVTHTSGGHWYTVVLHKNAKGEREYIAMDTGGLNVRQSAGVRRLIESIEGQSVARAI